MNKGLIAAGALLAGFLAFFWFRSSPSTSETETTTSPDESVATNRTHLPFPKRMQGTPDGVAGPKRYSGDGVDPQTGTKRYVRNDGTAVRDHRANAPEPNLDRRPTLPKELSKVQPETLRAVRLALRPAMKRCIATHVPEAVENSKAQAVLSVSIENELLHVDTLEFQTEGLSPESDVSLRECAEAAMIGHEQAVAGSPDVDKHVMTFPYNL